VQRLPAAQRLADQRGEQGRRRHALESRLKAPSVLGYGIIFLREVGWLFAIVVTLGPLVVFGRQDRHRDIGLLMAAEGVWPAFVAVWGMWRDATRADTEVGPEMWVFVGTRLLLIASGIAIFASTLRSVRGS
jgi:hypothetical protein